MVEGLQGVVIAWWIRARRGSTLAKLHHDWRSGTTLRGALTAGRHTGLLGLACIFSTLVVIDGPLLQRSSTVITGQVAAKSVPLNISMAQEVPTGYSGEWVTGDTLGMPQYYNYATFIVTMLSGRGREVSNDIWPNVNASLEAAVSRSWYSNDPLRGAVRGCMGSCKATLRAPALAQTACSISDVPVAYIEPGNMTTFMGTTVAPPLNKAAVFITNALVLGEKEYVTLVTGHASTTDCEGNLRMTACDYVSATGEYGK